MSIEIQINFVLQLISAWWKKGFQKNTFDSPEDIDQFAYIHKFISAFLTAYKCVCSSNFL